MTINYIYIVFLIYTLRGTMAVPGQFAMAVPGQFAMAVPGQFVKPP
jgi:hypothetical protein